MKKIKFTAFLAAFLFAGCLIPALQAAPVRVTPINEAEAVYALFWDPGHHEARKNWKVHAGSLSMGWCFHTFHWDRNKAKRNLPAFGMSMNKSFEIGDYNLAVFACSIPPQAKLRVTLDTDQGKRVKEWVAVSPYRDEYKMPLDGAKKIQKITFEIFDTRKNKISKGFLLWFGFENTPKLRTYLDRLKFIASQPLDKFLADPKVKPTFTGKVNMLAPAATLRRLQNEYAVQRKKTGKDPMKINLTGYKLEDRFLDVVPTANLALFGRVRDQQRKIWFHRIGNLVNKGLISRNEEMLRLAARTAVLYALIPNWDSNFLSVFMDTTWDQRVFSNSAVAEELALVLDYCSELLSPAGLMLITKRLSLEGLGQINYNVWRYQYLFGNNQLSVFSTGRVSAYLALEKMSAYHGEVVKPYTELAFKEMLGSVDKLIYPDGSFLEGPPYFGYTISGIQPVLEMYANARGKNVRDVTPACMRNLGNFGDAFVSTDRRGGVIPISSGQGNGRGIVPSVVQFLARIAPDSQWVNLYNRMYKAKGDALFYNLSLRIYHDQVSKKVIPYRAFVQLPVMGVMASNRYYKGKITKVLINGTRAKATCHRHNDRGSFVLEFAGDTFAADPGGQNYSDVDGSLVKRSDYHNMLVPARMPANEAMNVAPRNVYPKGKGDSTSFRVSVDATAGSFAHFRSWIRQIESPTPDVYTFTDRYTLHKGQRAARFLWITELPVTIQKNNVVRIDGKDAYCLITVPRNMKIRQETLIVRKKERYTRLSFEKQGVSGVVCIQARFFLKTPAKAAVKAPAKTAAQKKAVKK